jgi:hypothetical protein
MLTIQQENYQNHLQRIWDNQWLTNRGALVLELEEKLSSVLCPVHNKTYSIKVEENGLELLFSCYDNWIIYNSVSCYEYCYD